MKEIEKESVNKITLSQKKWINDRKNKDGIREYIQLVKKKKF